MKRLTAVFILIFAVLSAFPAAAMANGYVTLMFGRGVLDVTTSSCVPMTGSVNLYTIANDLQSRGFTATIPMTVDEIGTCQSGNGYASWADLDAFRDTYGWTVVPRGVTGQNLTLVSDPTVIQGEVCGALQTFYDHGFMNAWSLYAWPQNRWTESMQQTYVAPCYAYGRRYTATTANAVPVNSPDYWAYTVSVNGGRCANTSLSCNKMSVPPANRYYMPPAGLINTINKAKAGPWVLMQWYKLVTGKSGSQTSKGFAWDCTSTDPNKHWSTRAELYCYSDYLQVVSGIDTSTITVTDPATVANATGRTVPHP